MKVKATQLGYYNYKRRFEGDTFVLEKESHFSQKWMEKLPDSVDVEAEEFVKDKPAKLTKPRAKQSVI